MDLRTAIELILITALGGLLLYCIKLHRDRSRHLRIDYERLAVQSARDGLVVQDINGTVLWVNQPYCDIMGRDASEMIGLNPLRFALPPEDTPSEQEIQNFRYEPENKILKGYDRDGMHLARNQRKNGELFWMQISVSMTTVAQKEYAILVCRDVTRQIDNETALKLASQRLEDMSKLDALTSVANRRGLTEYVEQLKGRERIADTKVGLLYIDLDRFKEINDSYGHAAGDALLQHIAKQVSSSIRRNDLFARIGGDEFVALFDGLSDTSQLHDIAQAISVAVSKPLSFNGAELYVTASMGGVVASPAEIDLDKLLLQADSALYSVKGRGRNDVQFYDSNFSSEFENRSRRVREFAKSFHDGSLCFHFQPVLRQDNNEVRKFEALVRWHHPTEGLLEAADFLELAESSTRLLEVDLLAAKSSAALLSQLIEAGHQTIRVGINVSLPFLKTPNIAKKLSAILQETGVPPNRFVVEIAEAAFSSAQDFDINFQTLKELKDEGFLVVLDNFKAGSINLTYLPKLPIDGLKISRSITTEIETNALQQKVLQTTLDVAKDLRLLTIIPGIETAERAKLIAKLKGDRVQGHFYARPMPAENVLDWIDRHYSSFGSASDIAPSQADSYLGATSDL